MAQVAETLAILESLASLARQRIGGRVALPARKIGGIKTCLTKLLSKVIVLGKLNFANYVVPQSSIYCCRAQLFLRKLQQWDQKRALCLTVRERGLSVVVGSY